MIQPQLTHTHNFDQEKAEDRYKAADATCTESAVYYKSCVCGEKGEETFTAGEPLGHTWGEWSPAGDGKEVRYCDACGAEDYRTSEEDTYSVQMLFLHWLFPRMH